MVAHSLMILLKNLVILNKMRTSWEILRKKSIKWKLEKMLKARQTLITCLRRSKKKPKEMKKIRTILKTISMIFLVMMQMKYPKNMLLIKS